MQVKNGKTKALPKYSQWNGCFFKLFCFSVPLLNNLLWNISQPCCIEAIALWTRSFNKLIQERNCFLAGIFTLVFNHACLEGISYELGYVLLTCKCMEKHHILFSGCLCDWAAECRKEHTAGAPPATRTNPVRYSLYTPCVPGAQPRCASNPPPASGSAWRTESGTGFAPRVLSQLHSL